MQRKILQANALFWLALASCAAEGKPQPKLETRTLVITRRNGTQASVSAEIAKNDGEKEIGLMWRTSLQDGEGMLFVYERDEQLSFWMKNTILPLSIAFISSRGEILEIRDMEARSLRAVRSSRSARYALEAPQGWFTRAGVEAGDIVRGF